MTNNEAAKWIQLYIDLAKIDPSTGEEAYLNEDDLKTLESMEMARDALTCNRLATNLQPCKQDDLIRRSNALGCFHDWVDRYGDVHTPDEMAEYRAIEELPSVEPEIIRCKDCKHWMPHSQLGFDEDNGTYHDYCAKLVPEDEYYAFYRNADDFCSRAERITDD